jgi:hypothetical protein
MDPLEKPPVAPDNRPNASAGPEQPSPLPTISLPKGGGAIRDIGEKFSVNAATGTSSLTIPVPLSAGRSGFGPSLNLSYDSGSGNGPFGFGWQLGLSTITRKTDKELPRYLDEVESDTFILSSAEDLVPIPDSSGQNRVRATRIVHGTTYQIAWYRPRIEGLFSRIDAADTGNSHWRCITRDNVTTLYGLDSSSCISDPGNPTKIFSYLPSRTFDNNGNLTVYEYVAEDGAQMLHRKHDGQS